MEDNTYTVTRLESWDDETWEEICDAIGETVLAIAMEREAFN